MNGFKYELEKNGWSMYTTENLTPFKRFMYRLRGYKVSEMTDDFWKKWKARIDKM